VINACAEVRDVAKAEHWLSEMIKLDVKVDTVAYNNRG
jgi:pentatricopeptide repeat protein